MENMYSIAVTNKFSLALGDDEDPHEKLREEELKKEARKKEKLSEKENKSKQPDAQKGTANKTQKNRVIKDSQQQASKVQDSKKDQGEKKPPQSRTGGGDRNVKFSGESREERNNRRNREDGERMPRGQGELRRGPPGEGRETREFRNSNDNQRGEYGERRGRGGMRGGMVRGRGGPRGRGGYDYRGKREFDRQSGSDKTGIKPVDKKDGAGSHNWGTHNDEIEESLNQESQDWANEKPDGDVNQTTTETKEGEATTDTVEEKPVEEESRELTLDEWKALRNNRVKPQYNLRKAGEGEDLTRWKKMYALERKKEGADEEDEEEEEYDAAAEYPQRVGRQKRVLGIEIQFSDYRRGSGGRGRGRGRGERANGRGFGNRGAPRDGDTRGPASQSEQRSPRGRQNAPKVDDENDFPSLG
ncbi:Plasminogen activator inhibitor 1 RNA-binding protein [Eufriesea mexicana]|uniref:Plasminogen activator inhibitor 1 RNA-binding protein n=1 Tax=Eufriesea mexicana TaxID=516756 RepID=A0A310SSK2_9HYME|nr:PREDICTED: plasminogen activator inhibitor 1 RNA-binding protein-like [Eufriesea mexicana]OAD58968.1 Plasminogen activator inhibitor 1 RNA-binding protein [Eufriesea mexicana]